MKISCCIDMMFSYLDFYDRISAVKNIGIDAVEFWNWSNKDIDKITRASLITRLTNDVNQVQQFVNSLMRIIIKAPILCIGSFILAIKLNLELSIILFIGIVLIFIVIIINLKIGIPYFKKRLSFSSLFQTILFISFI